MDLSYFVLSLAKMKAVQVFWPGFFTYFEYYLISFGFLVYHLALIYIPRVMEF